MDPVSAGILGLVIYYTVQLVRPENKPPPAPVVEAEKQLPAPKHLAVELQKIETVELKNEKVHE